MNKYVRGSNRGPSVNNRISAKSVRVVSENGEMLGVLEIEEQAKVQGDAQGEPCISAPVRIRPGNAVSDQVVAESGEHQDAHEPARSLPVEQQAGEEQPPVAEPPVAEPPKAESPIASTVSVPADPSASDGEGGEWHLLIEKLNAWLADAKLMELWQQSQRPLKLLGGALGLLLVLQLTGAVLGTLDAIPMLPRLLQLTGLIYLILFASRRLVRSDERRSLIEGVQSAWSSFTGK